VSKIVLNTVTSGANLTNINNNFQKIADALNSQVLYRDNPVGEPNQIMTALDINGQDLINVDVIDAQTFTLNGEDVTAHLEEVLAQVDAAAATASQDAIDASASAAAAKASADNAAAVSLVTSVAGRNGDVVLTKSDVGLANVDNTADINKPISSATQTALDGKASLANANSFGAGQTMSYAAPVYTLNDTSGSSATSVRMQSNGVTVWQLQKTSANAYAVQRYSAGAYTDTPFQINSATGVATFSQRPVFGAATPWDSANLTPSNYAPVASPTFTGTVTIPTGASITKPNIVGTVAVDNAASGMVGEYLTANTSGTALTTGTVANATSITLTAGDWDVQGSVQFTPAGTTTVNVLYAGINTTSATQAGLGANVQLVASFLTGQIQTVNTPVVRISVSATTVVYLPCYASFGTSTMACNGSLRARRVR
jgi:hypothetical protein